MAGDCERREARQRVAVGALGRAMNLSKVDLFDGDFDFLPFAAGVECGEVPLYPTEADFFLAVDLRERSPTPATCWHFAAVRWRRGAGYGRPLTDGLKAIAVATAAEIRRLQVESEAAG